MRILFASCLLIFWGTILSGGETITIEGETYEDAEMVEVGPEGAIYKTRDRDYVVLPWKNLSPAQVSALKLRFSEALENAMFGAYFIEGTVFQVVEEGVIIQIDIPKRESDLPAENGTIIPTSGLVMIQDLPASFSKEEGTEIEIKAYKQGDYTFDIGIAGKVMPMLTVARPLWGREQEWINEDGRKMVARLIAIKDGVGTFERAGRTFPYEISKLDTDGQKRAAAIAEKLSHFPFL